MRAATPDSRGRRRLVLWRHGRTAWNVESRAQGQADVALDDVGRQQAGTAARMLAILEPAFIWSSDLQRATATAQELSRVVGIPVRLDRRLREYDVGIRQGTTFAEFRAAHPDIYERFFAESDFRVPGAELPSEVDSRMVEVISEAAEAVPAAGVGVLVGHGAALRAGIPAFFGLPAHRRNMFSGMANCAWCVLEEHPHHGWQIADYNARSIPGASSRLADDLPGSGTEN
ncbi:histidine phosphatase family protein [Brevibacterium daeguense]|uniref:Histidine phosphatase family protein n=1 Tax=Brevibacterium daeguense TaxID=909936 RepID=A0ABP8EGU3_9MICO